MNREAAFRLWFLVLVACAVAVLSGRVHAQTCYQWRMPTSISGIPTTYDGPRLWYDNPRAAGEEWLAWCYSNAGPAGYCNISCGDGTTIGSWRLEGPFFGNWPAASVTIVGKCPHTGVEHSRSVNLGTQSKPGGCPVCPPAGTTRSSIIEGDPAEVGVDVCGSDGCAYTIASPPVNILLMGGYGRVASVKSKGHACATRPETADDEVVENRECVDGAGNIACLDAEAPPGEGCGWFNGDYVCTGHVPDGSCVAFASGGVACTVGAASGPTDSNGDPAEPLGTVSNGVKTVNYYDSVTVNNSSTTVQTRPGQGGSAIGAPGRDGSGGGIGSGGGSGDGTGDGDVCPSGDCSGVGGPGLEEVCTIAECTQTFLNRVRNAPLLAAIANAGSSVPEGTCPSISINFGIYADDSYSLTEPMCEIYDQLAVFISPLFLLLWAWIGTRIVVSA